MLNRGPGTHPSKQNILPPFEARQFIQILGQVMDCQIQYSFNRTLLGVQYSGVEAAAPNYVLDAQKRASMAHLTQ